MLPPAGKRSSDEADKMQLDGKAHGTDGQTSTLLSMDCIRCLGMGITCNRSTTTCAACSSADAKCAYPPRLPTLDRLIKAKEVPLRKTEFEVVRLNDNDRNKLAQECSSGPLPEDEDYVLVVSVAREKKGFVADIPDLMKVCAQNLHHYETLMQDPLYANINQGQRHPTNKVHGCLLPLFREADRMIPCRSGHLYNPFLIAFVETLDTIQSDKARMPLEIHFVTAGISGFAAGIEAWEGIMQYFAELDKLHSSSLASNLFIVPVVEPHVALGRLPGWLEYKHKFCQKLNLRDIYYRGWNVKLVKTHEAEKARGNPTYLGVSDITQLLPGGVPLADEPLLDDYCEAAQDVAAWHFSWLGDDSQPTFAEITAQLEGCNLPFRD